jgi:protein-tyrosine phosphatase
MIGMTKYGVLFVCTGNICRSPTAEGVFRHYAAESGISGRLLIDSAGTHGYHVGEPPDRRAIAAAKARGIDMADLRARKFTAADFENFDLILAMDGGHHHIIGGMVKKDSKARLAMFMDFAPEAGTSEVPDPYYGDLQEFEHVLDLIERGAKGLLAHLQEQVKI